MQTYANNIQDNKGNAISGAFVLVKKNGAVASIYSDNGITSLANPFQTDSDGVFRFYAAAGTYDVQVTSPLIPAPIEYPGIILFDPEDVNESIRDELHESTGASLVGANDGAGGALWADTQEALEFFSVRLFGDATFVSTGGDDTAALQAFIDSNKGKRLVVRGVCAFAGVTMVGASYNKTKIHFERAKLLPAPTLGANNFQSALWCGLAVQSVEDAEISGLFDGNRVAQQPREQTMCLVLAGVKNVQLPNIAFTEVRGDGIYIAQSTIASASTNTDGVHIGRIYGYNSTEGDGRNLVSHISGDNIHCDDFTSINIGGVISGFRMPGGWDTEPNRVDESCNGIHIGRINVVHQGTSGISFQSQPGSKVTRNITVGSAVSVNTCAPDLVDGFGNTTVTNNHVLTVISVTDCTIDRFNGRFTQAYGDGIIISDSDQVVVDGRVRKCREGARIGDDERDASGTGVRASRVSVELVDVVRYGIRTGKLSGSKITGVVRAPLAGYYAGSLFGVFSRAYPQSNVVYSVTVDASALWTRSYRNDNGVPATYTNVTISDCDLSGTWAGFTEQMGDMRVMRVNVRGVTEQASAPAVGTLWVAGQQFVNSSGTVGQPRGWTISSANTLISWGNL